MSNNLPTFGGVSHFRVELNAIERFGIMSNSRVGRRVCPTDDMEVRWGSRQLVSVRHPYLPEHNKSFTSATSNTGVPNSEPVFRLPETGIGHPRQHYHLRF